MAETVEGDSYQADTARSDSNEKFRLEAEWQPIETAKPDNCIVAVWYWHSKTWVVGEAHWVETSPSEPGSWWWANVDPGDYLGDDIVNMGGKPTYWTPLPAPPGINLNISDEPERPAVQLNQTSRPDSSLITTLQARVGELESSVAEARAKAIEECAAIAETITSGPVYFVEGRPNAAAVLGGKHIAEAIRALNGVTK